MEAFQLRLWDGRIGRWLSPDPMGQYASPYLGMGNNPIGMIDPDGGSADWHRDGAGNLVADKGDNVESYAKFMNISIDEASMAFSQNFRVDNAVMGGGEIFRNNPFSNTTTWLDNVNVIGKSKSGNFSTPWMNTAISQFGVKELTGNNDGSKVKEYLGTTGLGIGNPWCSALVNWSMEQNGIKGTNSARALSWNNWGKSLSKPAYGSIATMTRKGGGHVGFVAGINSKGKIVLLGGNQGDMVKYAAYDQSKFVHFSYPKGYTPSYSLKTINVSTGATMQ